MENLTSGRLNFKTYCHHIEMIEDFFIWKILIGWFFFLIKKIHINAQVKKNKRKSLSTAFTSKLWLPPGLPLPFSRPTQRHKYRNTTRKWVQLCGNNTCRCHVLLQIYHTNHHFDCAEGYIWRMAASFNLPHLC